MRMPTLLPFGEGCMNGEAIDTRTRSIRRGSGHGTSEGWFVVRGGDPLLARVAASTSRQVAATAGVGQGHSSGGGRECLRNSDDLEHLFPMIPSRVIVD